MTEQRGNAEEVIGAALSAVVNLVGILADALVAKGVVTNEELVSAIRDLSSSSPRYGEHEAMVRMLLEGFLARYEHHGPNEGAH